MRQHFLTGVKITIFFTFLVGQISFGQSAFLEMKKKSLSEKTANKPTQETKKIFRKVVQKRKIATSNETSQPAPPSLMAPAAPATPMPEFLNGLSLGGQTTIIFQSSTLPAHYYNTGSFSADFTLEKKIGDGQFVFDLQFANGAGVDAPLQGGAMVNNDIMEDGAHHNNPYIAKAFYEYSAALGGGFRIPVTIGKFGVNDYFDLGIQVSDQATQFLNQAINNNGAFDYVQDLEGHGYTYGIRTGLEHDEFGLDLGFFSADSHLDNINYRNSIVAGLKWTPEWVDEARSIYQIYAFYNRGEYGEFTSAGAFVSTDPNQINTSTNADRLNKFGFGVSLNHTFPLGVDVFAKFGQQDNRRDVRHYQDMDRTWMAGFAVQGGLWDREFDAFGLAYEIGQLTGNHRLAHELGYTGFFDRTDGVGAGNYADEYVLEFYYRYGLSDAMSLSFDFQNVTNHNYNKLAAAAQFYGLRFQLAI